MMKPVTVVGSLFLASCNQLNADHADARICATAPTEIAPGEWGACIHKWAYRLARSPDPAKVVAEAVVAACSDAIAWQINDQAERPAIGEAIMRSAPQEALFRVVQSRAGNCTIP